MKKLVAILCVAISQWAFGAVEYEIILLAPPGKALETSAWKSPKIDERGYVIGSLYQGAYIYHPSFGFKLLGSAWSEAGAVNAQGNVVGILRDENWDDRLFFYNQQTDELIDLNQDPQLAESYPHNSIVGLSDDNKIFVRRDDRAFVYDIVQKQINFDLKPDLLVRNAQGQLIGWREGWFFDPIEGYSEVGSLDTFKRWSVSPRVLSDTGYVAGTGEDSQRDEKGFLWHSSLGLQAFDTLGGDFFSVEAINNHGHVVGQASLEESGDTHPFLYTQEQGTIDLGSFGGEDSEALDLNDHDQVVGCSENKRGERAFIWDAKQGMRDLNKLIPSNTGWKELNEASSINNQGYIVGLGIYNGERHAFLLIPKKAKK